MKPLAINIADIAESRYTASARPRLVTARNEASIAVENAVAVGDTSQALPKEKMASVITEGRYSQGQIDEAVERINDKVQKVMREIKFSVDDSSGRVVITVMDQVTKEVIREIPPEEVLNLADHLDNLQGVLIKEKA